MRRRSKVFIDLVEISVKRTFVSPGCEQQAAMGIAKCGGGNHLKRLRVFVFVDFCGIPIVDCEVGVQVTKPVTRLCVNLQL